MLGDLVRRLEKAYGTAPPSPSCDPFELILWEQVGYLVEDHVRARAFARLRDEVGLDAHSIIKGPPVRLAAICREGGAIGIEDRAVRIRESAQRVVNEYAGDLRSVLSLPIDQAKKALRAFPQIGEPGAEKILLFCRARSVLALESTRKQRAARPRTHRLRDGTKRLRQDVPSRAGRGRN